MFTGIIEQKGKVITFSLQDRCQRLVIETSKKLENCKIGDSIAINGICLTVVALEEKKLSFDLAEETLSCSSLGSLKEGCWVNIERPLAVGDRLDGHIVQGHSDGKAKISKKTIDQDGSLRITFSISSQLSAYIVRKGSIAIDGISLTVTDVQEKSFSVMLIPHTKEVTTLADKKVGEEVNIEVDILAKHVERLLKKEAYIAHTSKQDF